MRPVRFQEFQRLQNDFDIATRGLAHFSVIMKYADNSVTPNINATWEEIGFTGMLVQKQPATVEINELDNSITDRIVAPALLKIPKRFFYGGFSVSNPYAPADVQGQEFNLNNQYTSAGTLPQQTLLLVNFRIRSNYGEGILDPNHLGDLFTWSSEFYESPDAVVIELFNAQPETYVEWPNTYLTGVDSPEVTTLIGRYGRDAALELLGLV